MTLDTLAPEAQSTYFDTPDPVVKPEQTVVVPAECPATIPAAGTIQFSVVFANGDVEHIPLAPLGFDAHANVQVNVEDGLSVRLGQGDRAAELSWTTVRSITDPAYARHLHDLR